MRNSHIEESSLDSHLFTGKERDNESGLDYFGARYYDSRVGRLLSVDPLSDKSPETSPYIYTHNAPVNKIDPDGRFDFGAITRGINHLVKKTKLYTKILEQRLIKLLKKIETFKTIVSDYINNEVHPASVKVNSFIKDNSAAVGITGTINSVGGVVMVNPPAILTGTQLTTAATATHIITSLADGIHNGNNSEITSAGKETLIGAATLGTEKELMNKKIKRNINYFKIKWRDI